MSPVIFFDLGQTLGFEGRSADRKRILAFRLYPETLQVLKALRSQARLGLLTAGTRFTQDEVSQIQHETGLSEYIDPALVRHHPAESETHFVVLAQETTLEPPLVFISADSRRRIAAANAGWRVGPHPFLAAPLLNGDRLSYIRVTGSIGSDELRSICLDQRAPVVPLHLRHHDRELLLLAIAADAAVPRFQRIGLTVTPMPDPGLVRNGDLSLVSERRDESDDVAVVAAPLERFVLEEDPIHVTYAALDLDPDFAASHSGCGHGTIVQVAPSVSLLTSPRAFPKLGDYQLTEGDKQALADLTPALFADLLNPWWQGTGSLPNGERLASRHSLHPQNLAAVEAAAEMLVQLCGADHVRRCPFTVTAGTMDNIEAEIPPDPNSPYRDEIVVLGAHIDSIDAEHTSEYATGPAPGVDDDATGIAGVLAAAQILTALAARTPPRRRIRFVLFNAEEQRMQGSFAYVTDRHALERFVAMFQLDMIGYIDVYPPGPCEVHTGWLAIADDTVRQRSRDLGLIVQRAVAEVSSSLCVQLYPWGSSCEDDEGDKRSDQISFYVYSFPACWVCEDLFFDRCLGTFKDDHPTYHSRRDVCANVTYAADIARATVAAVWMTANN